MQEYFRFDHRLGIMLPDLLLEWECYSIEQQQAILLHWENIRGKIPDRIIDLEKTINRKQTQLSNEEDFVRSCELNTEISELSSMTNDLWIWYRVNPTISETA